MNKHLIYDSQLIEALRVNDTTAFEKLFDRYWFLLFQYANSKLDSEEEAKEIVRDIFIDLWENRSAITGDFSLIVHLYTRLRKKVAANLYKQICEQSLEFHRKNLLLAEFSVQHLKTAYKPVSLKSKMVHKPVEGSDDLRYPLFICLKAFFIKSCYCSRILLHEILPGSVKLSFKKDFMKLSNLENKLHRYIRGTANIAEVKQVDAWLSSKRTIHHVINEKKKEKLRQRILFEVQYYTDYPVSFPTKKEAFKKLIPILVKSLLIVLMLLYLFLNFTNGEPVLNSDQHDSFSEQNIIPLFVFLFAAASLRRFCSFIFLYPFN
jgi:hypothetical protein